MVLTDFPLLEVLFFSDVAHKSATNSRRIKKVQLIDQSIWKKERRELGGGVGGGWNNNGQERGKKRRSPRIKKMTQAALT